MFQKYLSSHMPALNSPDYPGHFWSLGGSKLLETSYLVSSRINWLDPGHETSAPPYELIRELTTNIFLELKKIDSRKERAGLL
jgi:hypothetical protein